MSAEMKSLAQAENVNQLYIETATRLTPVLICKLNI